MGLLDDAIREHLDLKRRHGADPAEVERAEREALGPVRRAPEEPDESDGLEEPGALEESGVLEEPRELELEPAGDQAFAYDHEGDEDWDEPFEDEPETTASDEPPDRAPSPTAEPFADDEPFAAEDPDRVPPPHPAEPPPDRSRSSEHLGSETVEYDVEAANEQEDAAGDDVLEETPEFLQDTPDHDRLWFEQRPPRDFDFDG
jgi:hypothetical protein